MLPCCPTTFHGLQQQLCNIMDYEEVLQNPLILHQIFKNLPNKFLLVSCSLVNKCWNREARTLIRDYRKCKACRPTHSTDCQTIQELDQICCRMTEEGRVIPFNSIHIWLNPGNCLSGPIKDNQTVMVSQLKVKFLEVDCNCPYGEADCFMAHKTLLAVLRQNANELRALDLSTLPPRLNVLLGDWFHGLPKLEKLTFSRLYDPELDSTEETEQIQLLHRILGSCPNLKRIAVEDFSSLEMLPVEKFKLLDKLYYDFSKMKDENIFRAVAEARPPLRKLRIYVLRLGSELRGIDGENFRQAFYRPLEILLQTCHSKLKKLSIQSSFPIAVLSFSPLVKLKNLEFLNDSGLISSTCKHMIDIDYERNMPNLEEVKINSYGTHEFEIPWPYNEKLDQVGVRSSAVSVWKLRLELRAREVHVALMKFIFPNVRVLEIQMLHIGSRENKGFLPLGEIFECWTDLTESKITDVTNFAPRYHDNDFCGIHIEEAELLREQDEEFLKAVHIVPIRPCFLTMPSLRKLGINFGLRNTAALPEFAIPFISKVTELFAFQKMPQVQVNIIGSFSQYIY